MHNCQATKLKALEIGEFHWERSSKLMYMLSKLFWFEYMKELQYWPLIICLDLDDVYRRHFKYAVSFRYGQEDLHPPPLNLVLEGEGGGGPGATCRV